MVLANAELMGIDSQPGCMSYSNDLPADLSPSLSWILSDTLPAARRAASNLRWRRLARAAWENMREWNTLSVKIGMVGKGSIVSGGSCFARLEDESCQALFGLHLRPFERRCLCLCHVEDEDADVSTCSL